MGAEMNLRRDLLAYSIILIMLLMILTPSFSQVKKDEIISFSGTIKNISKDLKSIVITNDVNILISPNTKIMDEKGNVLKAGDLKAGLYVAAEAVQDAGGFVARKIIIKPLRGT
jgi:hypothetical protein